MSQIRCPLDGRPCEKDCPDRYQPDGGCALTTLLELGGSVLAITPNQEKGATENE